MVRRTIMLLMAVAWTSPVTAQEADWSRAGGSLFAGAEIEAAATPADAAPDEAPASVTDAVLPSPVQPYAEAIDEAAARHGLDSRLLHALVVVESAYRPRAASPAGAVGLAQLMPATAAELGVSDREDATASIRGGAAYLAQQVVRFGDLRLALAAYNAGPGRVARLGRIPAIPETELYVETVVNCYLALSAGRSIRNARQCAGPGSRR